MAEQINLDKEDLTLFFVHHLNKIYSAKTHLLNRLPELLYEAHFTDLEESIFETIKIVQHQRQRMQDIYDLLGEEINEGRFNGLMGLIDDSFSDIKSYSNNPELRDMSILFYLTNIEATEMASFQILQLLAIKLKNDDIKLLIKENYDEAKADKTLLLLITTKYLKVV